MSVSLLPAIAIVTLTVLKQQHARNGGSGGNNLQTGASSRVCRGSITPLLLTFSSALSYLPVSVFNGISMVSSMVVSGGTGRQQSDTSVYLHVPLSPSSRRTRLLRFMEEAEAMVHSGWP